MGKVDGLVKAYLGDNQRFADAFNYFVYGGEQIVHPEELVAADTEGVAVPRSGIPVQRHRDSLRGWRVMRDGSATYALLGVEGQAKVDYAMPVRVLLYDALAYASQVEKIAREHKRRDAAGLTSAEFLSGFAKEDRVAPVVTLVLFLGSGEWDGATRLQDLMTPTNGRLAAIEQDWRVNILSPVAVPDEDMPKFRSDLGMVLAYIRDSGDVSKLGRMVEEDERWRRFDRVAALLLNEVTRSKLAIGEGEGEVDMCEAIKEMRRLSREEGREEGYAENMCDVIAVMRSQGYEERAIQAIVAAVEAGRALPVDPSEN